MLHLKLQSHHDTCEARYETAKKELISEERKRTLQLHGHMLTQVSNEQGSQFGHKVAN